MPYMELLNLEKDYIGCYVSGHPLDKYKDIIKDSGATSSLRLTQGQEDKQYTILGQLHDIRVITTKKGARMAFGKLDDIDGTVDLTFFPKV